MGIGTSSIFQEKDKSIEENKSRCIKIIAIFCFLLLTGALIIARNSPAIHYEASIYDSTPMLFWFLLIISFIVGIMIIVDQIYREEYKYNNFWMIGMTLIIISYSILLSLYIVRGYYIWNASGDLSTHLGWIKQIINDEHIPNELFYPVAHIYMAEITKILGINLMIVIKFVPLFFGILYLLFMHVFAKAFLSNKGQIILATTASTALVHDWYLTMTPNHLSNLFFPLVIYVLFKNLTTQQMNWKILNLIIVILYPVFHPAPTIALIAFLVALGLSSKALRLFIKEQSGPVNGSQFYNFTLLTILFVWGVTWISSFYVWESTIQNINLLINEGSSSHISELTNEMMYAKEYGYSVYEQAVKVMGSSLLYILMTIIALPSIWREVRANNEIVNLSLLYGPLLALSIIFFVLFTTNIGFSPLRMIIYVDIVTTIFVGFVLYTIIIKSKSYNTKYFSKITSLMVVFILLSSSMSGMMKLYPSPYTLKTSYHTTQMEVEGMEWIFNNRILSTNLTGISIAPGRFADLLLSPKEKSLHGFHSYLTKDMIVPYHFGYENNSLLTTSYEGKAYLAITSRDISKYVDVYKNQANYRWNATDFERLKFDKSIDKIYSNKEFNVWVINN